MKTAVTRLEAEHMYAFYREGHSLQETAARFYLSMSGVRHVFQKYNFPRRTNKHAILLAYDNRAETQSMYADYCNGMTCKQVAAKYQYDKTTIERRFQKYGFRMFRSPRQRRVAA